MAKLLRVEGKGNLFEIRMPYREIERHCGRTGGLGSGSNHINDLENIT